MANSRRSPTRILSTITRLICPSRLAFHSRKFCLLCICFLAVSTYLTTVFFVENSIDKSFSKLKLDLSVDLSYQLRLEEDAAPDAFGNSQPSIANSNLVYIPSVFTLNDISYIQNSKFLVSIFFSLAYYSQETRHSERRGGVSARTRARPRRRGQRWDSEAHSPPHQTRPLLPAIAQPARPPCWLERQRANCARPVLNHRRGRTRLPRLQCQTQGMNKMIEMLFREYDSSDVVPLNFLTLTFFLTVFHLICHCGFYRQTLVTLNSQQPLQLLLNS